MTATVTDSRERGYTLSVVSSYERWLEDELNKSIDEMARLRAELCALHGRASGRQETSMNHTHPPAETWTMDELRDHLLNGHGMLIGRIARDLTQLAALHAVGHRQMRAKS